MTRRFVWVTMETMQLLAFTLQGRIRITGDIGSDFASSVSPEPRELKAKEASRCIELNTKADAIAKAIEQDLRDVLPLASGISSQAEISFRPGSIILEGSLILLSWAGRTALEPIRDELGNLIKTVTKRAMARALEGMGVAIDDLAATPVPATPKDAPAAAVAVAPAPATSAPVARVIAEQPWLIVLVGLLTILILILLCDLLFFQSDVRRPILTQAAPVAEAPRLAPATPAPAKP